MPEIFVCRELRVDALSLEYNANLAPQAGRILGSIAAQYEGPTSSRNHQRREDPEERSLAATVWAEQSKEFRGTDIERYTVQRGAVLVPMHEVLHGNNGFAGRAVRSYSISKSGDFGNQRGPRGL